MIVLFNIKEYKLQRCIAEVQSMTKLFKTNFYSQIVFDRVDDDV